MAYRNEDISFEVNLTDMLSQENRYKIVESSKRISQQLEPIITSLGFIKANSVTKEQNREDENYAKTVFPDGMSASGNCCFNYIDNYKSNQISDGNFLICNIQTILTTNGDGGGFGLYDTVNPYKQRQYYSYYCGMYTKINFYFCRTNYDYDITIGPTRYHSTWVYGTFDRPSGYEAHPNLTFNSDLVNFAYVSNYTLWNWEDNYIKIPIKLRKITSDYFSMIALGDAVITPPHFGKIKINNEMVPFISVVPGEAGEYDNYYSAGNGTPPTGMYATKLRAPIQNLLLIKSDKYRYGTANFFENYSFKNSKNRIPLMPVFESTTNSSSSFIYDFSKPISGLYQTTKDYDKGLGVRYDLDNVRYIVLGNRYLMEEMIVEEEENNG